MSHYSTQLLPERQMVDPIPLRKPPGYVDPLTPKESWQTVAAVSGGRMIIARLTAHFFNRQEGQWVLHSLVEYHFVAKWKLEDPRYLWQINGNILSLQHKLWAAHLRYWRT